MRNVVLSILMQPFQTLPVPPPGAFASKTAIVTGGNTGLGLETARHLLTHGATHVIIGVRNTVKGETARESLRSTKGVLSDATIEVWDLDMASWASVKAFIAKAAALDTLDYLFLNAGLATYDYSMGPENWEQLLQVNVLSTALLALTLLPKLVSDSRKKKAATPADVPRLVITTSGLHSMAPYKERAAAHSLELLNSKKNFESKSDKLEQYMMTKLFDVYIVQELARLVPKVDGSPAVIINCVDPGLCKSELQRGGLPFPMGIFLILCGRTTEVGSRNLIAAARAGVESQGGYIADAVLVPPGGLAIGRESAGARQKFWGEIVPILAAVSPEIMATVDGKF